jgi:hypothetical protein
MSHDRMMGIGRFNQPPQSPPEGPPRSTSQTPRHAAKPSAKQKTMNPTNLRLDSPSWTNASIIGNSGVRRARAVIMAKCRNVAWVRVLPIGDVESSPRSGEVEHGGGA